MEFQEYGEHIGGILEVLREVETYVTGEDGKLLSFPKIAVIGDESHGKSSVLTSICQVSFPSGVGRTTRAPAIVTL